MRLLITVLFLAVIPLVMIAQKSEKKTKVYKSWIFLYEDPYMLSGYLWNLGDSMISLVDKPAMDRYDPELMIVNIGDINEIQSRRMKSGSRGFWYGAGIGFLIGGVWGLASGDDIPTTSTHSLFGGLTYSSTKNGQSAEQKALSRGVGCALAGGVLGAIFGSVKITIPIKKSYKRYEASRESLQHYCISNK
jgi:hypothetical protein